MAKMMGNDIVTQQEFDEFEEKTIKVMQKQIDDLGNQVKTLFAGVLLCLIATVPFLVKMI